MASRRRTRWEGRTRRGWWWKKETTEEFVCDFVRPGRVRCDRVETLSLPGLGDGEVYDMWGPNVRVGWVIVDLYVEGRSRKHAPTNHILSISFVLNIFCF